MQPLFQAIAQAHCEQELRMHIMVNVSQYFGAKRWGLFLFDFPLADTKVQDILKSALSVEHNPVLRYLTTDAV